ncbi:MAG: serine/threonine-protein kinase [Pseudomonadota bacterium]|nr:MAG: hypothetical protein DIU78_13715 [Pseudomonadota bacterium]
MNRENPARAEQDALIGVVLGGRYRIEALIGSGGMGAVYRAEHVHMKKTVAVKVLHREMMLNPEVVARFEREAVAGGRIDHPHVASAIDFGRLDSGVFYLALEFVEGRGLRQVLKQEGPFPEQRALTIAWQIADALSAAHAAGVVHRDLKPDNVMLLDRDGIADFVKVLDFGIAKVRPGQGDAENPLTQLGTVFGTPEYMSPEQARGLEVDGRSDLYAFGIILYEMLTGRSPFAHEDVVAVLARQLTMDPPPLPAHVSRETRELVARLLRKDPAERVPSADAARDLIYALLEPGNPALALGTRRAVLASGRGTPDSLVRAQSGVARREPAEQEESEASAPAAASSPQVATAPTVLAGDSTTDRQAFGWAERWLTRARGDSLQLFGYSIPRSIVLGLVALVGIGAATTVVLGSRASSETGTTIVAVKKEDEDDLPSAVIEQATSGDTEALARLLDVPRSRRSLETWRALGRGHCVAKEFERCLELYRDGIAAKPALADDLEVLRDLRALAEIPAVGLQALDFFAERLGSAGPDLLFDVWNAPRAKDDTFAKRARELLGQERVKARMTPALAGYFELAEALKAPRCKELQPLLERLGPVLDARSVTFLNRLTHRRGCGFLGLSDCYSCLRAGNELKTALDGARARPAPQFMVASWATPQPSSRPAPSTSRPAPRR